MKQKLFKYYMKRILVNYYIFIFQLKVDTVSLIVKIPHKPWTKVRKKIHRFQSTGKILKAKSRSTWFCGKNYVFVEAHNFKVKDGKKVHKIRFDIAVGTDRNDNEQGLLQITFDASKMTVENKQKIRDLLQRIFGKYFYRLFTYGHFSRIDFCVDLAGIHIDEIMLFLIGAKTSKVVHYPNGGKVIYAGDSGSPISAKAYNKLAQVASKYNNNKNISDEPITRIEITLKKSLVQKDLFHLKNPFNQIKVFWSNLCPTEFEKEFRDDVEMTGIHKALKNAKEHGIDYEEALKPYEAILFDQDMLWTELPKALDFLDIFYPNE